MEGLELETQKITDLLSHDEQAWSGRRVALLQEAELRAEQQAAARQTMLDLAREVEEGAARRKELEAALSQEQTLRQSLQEERDKLDTDLSKIQDSLDSGRIRAMKSALKASLSKGTLARVGIYWVNQVRPVHDVRNPDLLTPLEEEGVLKLAREERREGSKITIRWMFLSWKETVADAKNAAADAQEYIRGLKEQLRQQQDDQVAKDKEAKKAYQLLQHEKELLAKENEALLAKLQQKEAELSAARTEAKETLAKHQGEVAGLKAEIVQANNIITDRESRIFHLQQALREEEEAHRRSVEEAEERHREMKAHVREMSAQLQQALLLAKHLREAALRTKREAAGCISPEKFSLLVGELEQLREHLTSLGHEREQDKDMCDFLKTQLQQNRRRLELERQFLPLLHKARGPVGPQNPTVKGSHWAAKTAAAVLAAPLDQTAMMQDRSKMPRSASVPDGVQMQRQAVDMARTAGAVAFPR